MLLILLPPAERGLRGLSESGPTNVETTQRSIIEGVFPHPRDIKQLESLRDSDRTSSRQ